MKRLFLIMAFAVLFSGCSADDDPYYGLGETIYEFLGGDANKRLVYDSEGVRSCWILTEYTIYFGEYPGRFEQKAIEDGDPYYIMNFTDNFELKYYFVEDGKATLIKRISYACHENSIEWCYINYIIISESGEPKFGDDSSHGNFLEYDYINASPVSINVRMPISDRANHLYLPYPVKTGKHVYSESCVDVYIQVPLSDHPYIN